MATDFYHWVDFRGNPILIKIVITANPRWYSERAFSELKYGMPVKVHNRYIFITDDKTADLESLTEYWEARVLEVLNGQ